MSHTHTYPRQERYASKCPWIYHRVWMSHVTHTHVPAPGAVRIQVPSDLSSSLNMRVTAVDACLTHMYESHPTHLLNKRVPAVDVCVTHMYEMYESCHTYV